MNSKYLSIFFYIILIVALVYSKFMISIAMLGLLSIVLFDIQMEPFSIRLHPNLRFFCSRYCTSPEYYFFGIFFLICLISGFWSDNFAYFAERIRIRLPFLILPFAFFNLPTLSRNDFYRLHYLLIMVLLFSAVILVAKYFTGSEEIIQAIKTGQAMPTPMNHIRYSLLIAYATIAGCIIFMFEVKNGKMKMALGIGIVLLILFEHFLSVRTGLVSMYLSLFLILSLYIIQKRQFIAGGILGLCLLISPIIAYHYVPSFRYKVDYTKWDWDNYRQEKNLASSDASRMVAWELARKSISEHPIFGVGLGDVKNTMEAHFTFSYPSLKPKLPHNQYLTIWLGTGLLGLFVFILMIMFPVFYHRTNLFVLAISLVCILSMFVEDTLENAIGTAIYTFFLFLAMRLKEC
ncbi:MAG: O-antigen ligase family protein [Saprospiraceae bacterium]